MQKLFPFLICIISVIFYGDSCGSGHSDPDVSGVVITNNDLTIKSGEAIKIDFKWKLNYSSNSCQAYLTLHSKTPP